jgi:hypothetical protein
MADVIEVGDTLVNLIACAVYPNGIENPSITGDAIRVFQGWPIASQLREDSKTNTVAVSVYPKAGQRNTTRFAPTWHTVNITESS